MAGSTWRVTREAKRLRGDGAPDKELPYTGRWAAIKQQDEQELADRTARLKAARLSKQKQESSTHG